MSGLDGLAVAAGVLLGIGGIALLSWSWDKSERMLREWAATNGYRVVDFERRWLRQGPFFVFSSKNQTVFYVTLADRESHVRHAYVRCGGWFLGMLSDQVNVEWVD